MWSVLGAQRELEAQIWVCFRIFEDIMIFEEKYFSRFFFREKIFQIFEKISELFQIKNETFFNDFFKIFFLVRKKFRPQNLITFDMM